MARKFVHILFALLFIGTFAVMLRILWLEGTLESASRVFVHPVLALLALAILSPLFFCEYFFYRSILFLVSYPGDEPVALGASIITTIASTVTLLYLVHNAIHMKPIDNTIVWFSLGVQFVCRLVVWVLMRDVATDDSQEAVE